jgi:hypothetical protein
LFCFSAYFHWPVEHLPDQRLVPTTAQAASLVMEAKDWKHFAHSPINISAASRQSEKSDSLAKSFLIFSPLKLTELAQIFS